MYVRAPFNVLYSRAFDTEDRASVHGGFLSIIGRDPSSIILSVVTTLSCSILIFNALIISVRHKCTVTYPTATSFLLVSLLNC